jgi:hypothetical protein
MLFAALIVGCSSSTIKPRPRVCPSLMASAIVLIGPAATPTFLSGFPQTDASYLKLDSKYWRFPQALLLCFYTIST